MRSRSLPMTGLLRNLTSYDGPGLIDLNVLGTPYKTAPNYNPDYIVSFAFGNADAPVTKRLALAVVDAQHHFNKEMPVLAQHAVLKNMAIMTRGVREFDFCLDTETRGEVGKDIPKTTYQALMSLNKLVEGYDMKKREVLFVMHSPQMERGLALCERQGYTGEPFFFTDPLWNIGKSSSPGDATISEENWKRREIITRVHHKLFRWL